MIVKVLNELGRRMGEQRDFSRVTKCKEEPKRAEEHNSWKKKKNTRRQPPLPCFGDPYILDHIIEKMMKTVILGLAKKFIQGCP